MRVLVAGFGNVLRGDDGFGVAVAHRLLDEPCPEGVRVLDVGIGGIQLVQELLDPVDAVVAVDTVDLGRPAGTVMVVRPDVREASSRDDLADIHYATPERAFMLSRGLDILQAELWLIGCQPAADRLGEGLSPELAAAVERGAAEVRRLVSELGVAWG